MSSQNTCAVAVDTKLETPEGPLRLRSLVRKAAPVFSFDSDAKIRFRMFKDAELIGESQPVLRVTLDTGKHFRVGAEQLLLTAEMEEVAASQLKSGSLLKPAFTYPRDYSYHDDVTGEPAVSQAALAVDTVESDGEADVYAFSVNVSGNFLLSAGVFAKAR